MNKGVRTTAQWGHIVLSLVDSWGRVGRGGSGTGSVILVGFVQRRNNTEIWITEVGESDDLMY